MPTTRRDTGLSWRGGARAPGATAAGAPAWGPPGGSLLPRGVAAVDNGRGIAGLAPSARLLIAKVVRGDGKVSPQAEAQAIRWVVSRGARVVNVSLAGPRDPSDGKASGFSPIEQRAVDFATRHG